MRYQVVISQRVTVRYETDADSEEEAKQNVINGKAEEVEGSMEFDEYIDEDDWVVEPEE